jgi:V/A-type H+-transporting ATPase subunit D
MWLSRRLVTADRGREQLDRKLRILLPERRSLQLLAERRHREWGAASTEASTWVRRAALLGGEDALRTAAGPGEAVVTTSWTTTMGLRVPVEARVIHPDEGAARSWGNAALAPAVAAVRRSVEAGARLAAVEEAVRRLDAEIAVTRRRLRALEKRWLPGLADAARDLELRLEQGELEDGIRLRHRGVPSPDGRLPS